MEVRDSCIVINPGASRTGAEPGVGRAVLLTGNPRGGTTFIASAAHHLGIPLGKRRPRYEDRKLRFLLLGKEPDEGHVKLEAAIRKREAMHEIWGWKLPAISRHFDLVDGLVRHPIYVLVFKEPVSIAMRRAKTRNPDALATMRNTMVFNLRLLDFLDSTKRECVLVSYDKAIRNQAAFIRDLAEIAGVTVTDARIAEIVEAVKADNDKYDRKSAAAEPDSGADDED